MANTQTYETTQRLRRWARATSLYPNDLDVLSVDLIVAAELLKAQSLEIKALKNSVTAYRMAKRPPKRVPGDGKGSLVPAGMPIPEQAQRVAEAAADGRIDVYRYQIGTVRWLKAGRKYDGKGEYIGTYDEGCDWRQVAEDLKA